MDYSKLSDFEINKLVASAQSLLINDIQCAILKVKSSSVLVNDIVSSFEFNPCNNPSDAWTIIVENDISLNSIHNCQSGICEPTGRWLAEVYSGGISAKDKNPLRAAMIVYLMMQGG